MEAPPLSTSKSGIYCILCVPTGKIYIGSARNIGGRIRGHLSALNKGKHHNKYLQRAWSKYGRSAFSASVVEFCTPSELLDSEQRHIDANGCVQPVGFNLHPKARSSSGIRRSPDTLERMRAANLGKTISPETRAKISATLKEVCRDKKVPEWVIEKARVHNTGRPLTDKQKAKMSAVRKGRARPKGLMKRLADFNRGKKRPPEVVEKMRQAAKKFWEAKKKTITL